MIQNTKSITILLKIIALAILTFFSVSFAQAATWTAPTQSFPNANTNSPIHTGTGFQTKGSGGTDGIAAPYLIGNQGGFFGGKLIVDREICFGHYAGLMPWLGYISGNNPNAYQDCISSWDDLGGGTENPPVEGWPIPGTLNHTLRYNGTAWQSSGLMQNDGNTISILRAETNPGNIGFDLVKKAYAQMQQGQGGSDDIFTAMLRPSAQPNPNRGLRVTSSGQVVVNSSLAVFGPATITGDVTIGSIGAPSNLITIGNAAVTGNGGFGSLSVNNKLKIAGDGLVNKVAGQPCSSADRGMIWGNNSYNSNGTGGSDSWVVCMLVNNVPLTYKWVALVDGNLPAPTNSGPAWTGTYTNLPADGTVRTYSHSLGYIPMCMITAQAGNVHPHVVSVTNTQITISQYNTGNNGANGIIRCW